MLSEFIRSVHSYSALPLAGQQTHQRYVQLGPLVTYNLVKLRVILSPITRSVDYIFILHKNGLDIGVLQIQAVVFLETIPHCISLSIKIDKSLRGQT